LRTTKELISGKTKPGEPLDFVVVYDVLGPANQVIIEHGTVARGKIGISEKRRLGGRPGRIRISVESTTAADGTTVVLRGAQVLYGKSNIKDVETGAFIIGGIIPLTIRGRDVVVPAGFEFSACVDRDTRIKSINQPRSQQQPEPAEAVKLKLPGGARIRRGEKLVAEITPLPAEKAVGLFVELAGTQQIISKKDFGPITLDTRDIPPGHYTLRVDVTFLSGAILTQSADIEIY